MQSKLPFFPEQASTMAGQVDYLYLFLVLITTFFSLLIAILILSVSSADQPRTDRYPRADLLLEPSETPTAA